MRERESEIYSLLSFYLNNLLFGHLLALVNVHWEGKCFKKTKHSNSIAKRFYINSVTQNVRCHPHSALKFEAQLAN